MPLGSPVTGSVCASTGLPRLIAARSFPVGARSFLTASIAGSPKAADAMPQANENVKTDRANAVTRSLKKMSKMDIISERSELR